MHRNTYINSPSLLNSTFNLKEKPNIFFAGQITGVEGYVESIASGLSAGLNAVRVYENKELVVFPTETVIRSIIKIYIFT